MSHHKSTALSRAVSDLVVSGDGVKVPLVGTHVTQFMLLRQIEMDLLMAKERAQGVLSGAYAGDSLAQVAIYESALFRYCICFENVHGYLQDGSAEILEFMRAKRPQAMEGRKGETLKDRRNDVAHRNKQGHATVASHYRLPDLQYLEILPPSSELAVDYEAMRNVVSCVDALLPEVRVEMAGRFNRLQEDARKLTPHQAAVDKRIAGCSGLSVG